jgi:beta-lactamase superfamily II metal-dependent hydrolase
VSFEFDCIDADYVDSIGPQLLERFRGDETKPFALLRVVTTSARFDAFADTVPEPGNWFHLKIEPVGTGLPTWHAQLTADGYSTLARGVTKYARRLDAPDDTPSSPRPLPQSLGAAVASQIALPSSLVAACAAFPRRTPRKAIFAILKTVSQATSVVVRDVGQANFISLCDRDGRSILHYDVGFPIAFNGHTSPISLDVDINERPPIILSHWDWDHLHAAFRLPHLLDCRWIVPDQRLGPGAARLARILAAKGNLLVWSTSARRRFGFGEVSQGEGPPGDLNDTGLTALIALGRGRRVLVTGDADYSYLRHAHARRVDHLVATHHGARFETSVALMPAPRNANSKLFISYGTRNVYRHPHPEALRKYSRASWTNWVTTAGRKGVARRGDRVIS